MKDVEKIQKLEAALANSMTERSRLLRQIKDTNLNRGILDALVDEMKAILVPFDEVPALVDHRKTEGDIVEEHLVMWVSDQHGDEVVEPHKVGGIEKFDMPTFLCRCEQHVDTVIDFTQNKLSNYRFPILHILQLGDQTSGEIHGSKEHSYYKNMFRNCLAIGQANGLMIRDLAPYFKEIHVVNLPGNHGRRSIKKDFENPWDNWDYLCAEVTSQYVSHLRNVKTYIPDCFSLNYDINGWGFNLQHGDDIKSWNGIPWYGIERKTRRMTALQNSLGKKVSYFGMGHFHSLGSIADIKGETLINGSYIATNPYSYESFSGYREPMQLLHGVHPDHGISWRLPVKLKNEAKEAVGPSRYHVILANEAMPD